MLLEMPTCKNSNDDMLRLLAFKSGMDDGKEIEEALMLPECIARLLDPV